MKESTTVNCICLCPCIFMYKDQKTTQNSSAVSGWRLAGLTDNIKEGQDWLPAAWQDGFVVIDWIVDSPDSPAGLDLLPSVWRWPDHCVEWEVRGRCWWGAGREGGLDHRGQHWDRRGPGSGDCQARGQARHIRQEGRVARWDTGTVLHWVLPSCGL